MISEPALVALLYHADWTQLSLSAEVTQSGGRSRLLIAPGGRYRVRTAGEGGDAIARGCDGDRPWRRFGPLKEGEQVRLFGGPEVPFPVLLCPSWLLSGFELALDGTAAAGGRDGLRVVASPRPPIRGSRDRFVAAALLDRVEVIVDAELGILLRCERVFAGQGLRLEELRDVTPDPPEAADPAQFAPPAGSTLGEGPGALFTGPGWRAARTAAGLGAAGLGFAVRHAPRRPPQTMADEEAGMPQDEPGAAGAGQPGHERLVSDELVHLLYRSGSAVQDLAAELHEWRDAGAIMEHARSAGDSAGIPGLGHLADALVERMPSSHQVTRIRFAAPDRYRVDYVSGQPKHKPKTIACDGQHRWKVYGDRVAVGPAAPLPAEIADLIDPSWLLQRQLTGGAPATVRGRRGFRVRSVPKPQSFGPRPGAVMAAADVVADAELDAPEPLKVAAKAASDAARRAGAAVTAVASFLDAVRGRASGRPTR